MLLIKVIAPITLVLLIFSLFAHKADASLDYKVSKYSEEEWLKIARDAVHGMGMVDKPQHEQWALMTRGSYLTLQGGGGSPQDREAPLFIYKGFGNIPVLTVLGGGLDGPARDIGGVELIFDGNTGFITSWAAFTKDNVAHGLIGVDLSNVPADTGYNPHLWLPVPTAGS